MATYGSAAAGTGVANCENAINWFAFTVGAAGETPATADVWLNESTTTNAHTWKVVLHRASDGVFIAETNARSDIITGGPASYQFTFSTSPSLSNVEYRAGVFANSGAGNANVIKNDSVGGPRYNQTPVTYPNTPDPATFTEVEASAQLRMTVTTNDAGGSTATVTPGVGSITSEGRAPTVNSFTAVAIREVFINEAGSPVANRTGIHLHVWYGGHPHGAPDLSYSNLTTDGNGTASWSLPTGGLTFNQHIFYVANDGSSSLSEYTCARLIPTYTP